MGGGETLPMDAGGAGFRGVGARGARDASSDQAPRPVRVFITGFGAYPKFPDSHWSEDDNASHLITKLLPDRLPAGSRFNHTQHDIELINPTGATGASVRVEYEFVRGYAEQLWNNVDAQGIDLVVHLGMADGIDFYTVERGSWREGTPGDRSYTSGGADFYTLPDNIGQTIRDLDPATGWDASMPQKLLAGPDLDVDAVVSAVSRQMAILPPSSGAQRAECRAHQDAGPYLCGFIYYESLARATVHRHATKVVFSHVPSWKDPASLEHGREYVSTLISCLVEQLSLNGLAPR